MSVNLLASHRSAIAGVIDPDAYAAGTETSDYVSLDTFKTAQALILVGEMEANSTVDAKLVQATDSAGTGKKDITGKAMTQLTEASADDDKQQVINVRDEELDIENGFTHVALEIETKVAASDSCGVIMGSSPANGPASDNDVASVSEIVA